MKTNDLRIGNLIDYFGDIIKVDTIDYFDGKERVGGINTTEGDRVFDKPSYFDPIELTEEVLLKIGFKKDGNNYSLVCDDIEVGFYIDKFKQVLYINVSREKRFYKNELRSYDVKYLHQLQNAYYILTNKEMRDAFCENFEYLIKKCKKLL